MPLDAEFLHHLRELMVETSDKLRDELGAHKRQLIWSARQTNNSAALPAAYSQAAIYAFRTRVQATIAEYLNAVETCGIVVDASVESEMLQIIRELTSAIPSLTLPTGLKAPNASAVEREHKMELARVGAFLFREAANRIREAKIRARKNSSDIASVPMASRPQPFTIASVAKTLAELKSLPPADQAMLLLRRLAHIAPQGQSIGGLNKGNLLLPNDPYGLAAGFPASENMPVRQHLLGAPWTRLVNEGFLVDPSGSGFFCVSEDGLSAAKSTADFKPTALAKSASASRDDGAGPSVFVSYSGESPEHKEWVLRLAERLRVEGGLKVILDRWHLPVGGDRTLFMEQSIGESQFVLIVCTPTYAEKANNRAGGVGYESMIISSQLAQQILQNKFIPVLRSGNWDSSLPMWIKSKIGVDLRGDTYDAEQYDLLVRTLHQAQPAAPPVGPKPTFDDTVRSERKNLANNAVSAVLESLGASTNNGTKFVEKWVDINYPSASGIQKKLEDEGWRVAWCLDTKLPHKVDIEGWEIVIEPDAQGVLTKFRLRGGPDQTLIKQRNAVRC